MGSRKLEKASTDEKPFSAYAKTGFLALIGMRVFNLDLATLQTLMFLKMTVAGHMTIYLARTGVHHFWEHPLPSRILFAAAELTQVAGTFIVAYGIFMTPIEGIRRFCLWLCTA